MMTRMPREAAGAVRTDYELIDAGEGRRLERFGARTVDRPAPAAATFWRRTPDAWSTADLRFDADDGWTGSTEPWQVDVGGLLLELRATPSGGVGLFPEHVANVEWLTSQVRARARDRQPAVLNLFAHTGLATLAAARAGAAVAHVDAARSAVAWPRGNAARAGLADRPIRWLVDDAAGFVAREARRGRRYDGIVLDPPSFGRADRNRWRLVEQLPALLAACRAVAADDAFVLLTAHTSGLTGADLAGELDGAFGTRNRPVSLEVLPLQLDAASGARLELGWAVRLTP
jgi:23S rRNA (cytosine1962-C5)-methyltransferase